MLKLFFLRHGEAGDRDPAKHPDDSKRPLTKEGTREMKDAGDGLARAGIGFDRIFSSPYVRARETAEIVARRTKYPRKIGLSEALAPNASFDGFRKFLEGLPKDEKLLFVGHEPMLSDTVSHLLIGRLDLPMDFKKGAICRVDVEGLSPLRARLKWFMGPKLLKCFGP